MSSPIARWRREGSRDRCALVARVAMEDVSRAFEKGETEGFMRLLVDAGRSWTPRSLGTGVDEVIHCVLDATYAKAP